MTRARLKICLGGFLVVGICLHLITYEGPYTLWTIDVMSTYRTQDDPLAEATVRPGMVHEEMSCYSLAEILRNVLENSASHSMLLETSTSDNVDNGTTLFEDVWLNHSYVLQRQPENLPSCAPTPPGLVGPVRVFLDEPSMDSLQTLYPDLEAGGHGQPDNCTSRHRVAIVIPYRDRDAHLRIFLHNMHALLRKQQLDYFILVVEQIAEQTFNRAKLMNVGYAEAMKLYPWECFIFHDVDLLPEDDRNLYTCPTQPRHMSVAVDKFSYKLPYGSIFGGITALTVKQLQTVNGFSNDYWGWGGEDDDLSTRVKLAGYKIARYPAVIARYKMIKHKQETSNPVNKCRYKLMAKTKDRYQRDGLNSLNYKVLSVDRYPLYAKVLVDLMETESKRTLKKEIRC